MFSCIGHATNYQNCVHFFLLAFGGNTCFNIASFLKDKRPGDVEKRFLYAFVKDPVTYIAKQAGNYINPTDLNPTVRCYLK